jgi:hypothetical protein
MVEQRRLSRPEKPRKHGHGQAEISGLHGGLRLLGDM